MTSRHAKGRSAGDGYVLVAVLSVLLALTGLIAAGSILVRSALHSARLSDDDVGLAGLTWGGLEIAAYEIFSRKLPLRLVDGRPVRLANAMVTPFIVDEAGKIDLNGADPKLLKALFDEVGVDGGTDLVAAIVKFRGKEAQANGTASQQPAQPVPSGEPPPKTDKTQRGFQSVDQLRDLGELTRGDWKSLSGLLTVFNPDGKVDILTAPEEVLQALPGVTKPKVEEILARRRDADKTVKDELRSMLGEAGNFAKIEPGPAYSVRIAVATPSGQRRAIEAVIAASKSPNDPFYILDWRE